MILKIVFRRILYIFFCFLNVVWALASGGFRIVSDTLVCDVNGDGALAPHLAGQEAQLSQTGRAIPRVVEYSS